MQEDSSRCSCSQAVVRTVLGVYLAVAAMVYMFILW